MIMVQNATIYIRNVPGVLSFYLNDNGQLYYEAVGMRRLSFGQVIFGINSLDYCFEKVVEVEISRVCKQLKDKVKKDAIAISLIKGLSEQKSAGFKFVSNEIKAILNIEVAVLMEANLAPEVTKDNYCEATIGTKQRENHEKLLKTLFHTEHFRINVVEDLEAVELCGVLKNIVVYGTGFSDGFGYENNTKAAVIRLGMMKIVKVCFLRKLIHCASQNQLENLRRT